MLLQEDRKCGQLRRLAITQQRMLDDAEKAAQRDDTKIEALKRSLERTRQQREELGCLA